MKIKQIRGKKLIFNDISFSRKELILLSFTYKIIIYLKLLQKYENSNKIKLMENNFFKIVKELKEYGFEENFINKLLNYIEEFVFNKKIINIYYMLFLGFVFASETVPTISKDDIDINFIKDFAKKSTLSLKNLLSTNYELPEVNSFPYFRCYINDIVYDNNIIRITCNHKINYIPTINKVIKEIKEKNIKNVNIFFINPRFKVCKKLKYSI